MKIMSKKYEYEYMVTSVVIKRADEIAKVLHGMFNQKGYDGWELVQWNFTPHELLPVSSSILRNPPILVIVTFRKKLLI